MAYKLEVDHPGFPKDFMFDLDGIACKNGSSVTVTEEMEKHFLAKNGKTLKDIYGHSKVVKLSGTSEVSSKEKAELIPEGGEK